MARKYREGDEAVPGFRLERFLGQGAIGEVWQAVGPGGTEAAIKIVDLSGSGAHGLKEFRAMQLVKRIHHPHLTPIMGLWAKDEAGQVLDEQDTALFASADAGSQSPRETIAVPPEPPSRRATELIIAMGLGRQSLADRLEECRRQGAEGIPVEELLGYLRDAARAIDFLNSPVHALASGTGAIVHCDIKPLNILIVGGAAQVCDFGLAHMIGAARKTAAAMGTIAYAAPELLDGKPSPTTDQYCLAITYYELRTGTLPYEQQSAFAVIEAVRQGDLDFSRVPEAERAVLRKATSIDPGARYGSAMELVQALRAAVLGEATPSPKPRPRWAVATLGAIAVGGLSAVAAYLGYPYFGISTEPAPKPVGLSTGKGGSSLQTESIGGQTPPWPIEKEKPPVEAKPPQVQPESAAAGTKPPEVEPQPPAVDAVLAECEGLLKAAQWDEARRKLLEAFPRAAGNGRLLVQLGRACLGLDLVDEALDHFSAAVRADPRDPEARFGRGIALTKKRQFDEAVHEFETLATTLDPDGTLGYRSRPQYADAYLGVGTRCADEARELLSQAADAKDPEALKKKAVARLKDAVAQLDRAIEHDPGRSLLWSRRGAFRRYLPDFEGALADITKAIELGGDEVDKDLVFRGELRQRMAVQPGVEPQRKAQLLREAEKDFEAAARKNPKNPDAPFFLAGLYTLLADRENAKDHYAKAVAAYTQAIAAYVEKLAPWFTLPEAHYGRARCLILIGRLQEAAEDFTRVLQSPRLPDEPAHVAEMLHELAKEFRNARQIDEARQWNRRAVELAPDRAKQDEYRAVEKSWQPAEK